MVATKQPKYETFGDMLSTETAFLQAASALDNAAFIAVKQGKPDDLTNIAAVWMELGSRLMNAPDEEDDEEAEDGDKPVRSIGFGVVDNPPELGEINE